MAKTQTIRRRIRSVRNINQITKAMEMVAASKLRRSQDNALRSRLYAQAAEEALGLLRLLTVGNGFHLFEHRPVHNRLVIMFSSDRGLAGAYNSNVFRLLLSQLEKDQRENITTRLIAIGSKGAQFAARLQARLELTGVYANWPAQPATTDLQPIAATVFDLFRQDQVDSVSILYTDFISTIRQSVRLKELLPIDPATILTADIIKAAERQDVLFEPSPEAVLHRVVPRFLEMQLFQAALEASASEQAMRMMAMKNASDNAKELIGDLTLTFNGVRQAAITQELAEISAGAAAIA